MRFDSQGGLFLQTPWPRLSLPTLAIGLSLCSSVTCTDDRSLVGLSQHVALDVRNALSAVSDSTRHKISVAPRRAPTDVLRPTFSAEEMQGKSAFYHGWAFVVSFLPLWIGLVRLAASCTGATCRAGSDSPPEHVALMAVTSRSVDWLLDATHGGPVADHLECARQSAVATAQALGFPHSRVEEWRFTDLSTLRRSSCEVAPPVVAPFPRPYEASDGARALLVNGHLQHSDFKSLPPSVCMGPINAALYQPLAQSAPYYFSLVNMALCPDVLCITIPAGVVLERPIHLVYSHTQREEVEGRCPLSSPRVVVVVGEDAQGGLIEEFVPVEGGKGPHASIPVLEVKLAKGATLSHTVLQLQAEETVHLKTTVVQQAAASAYREVEVNVGARVARHDVRVEQGGPATTTDLRCFSLVGQGQCHDLHSCVLLGAPNAAVTQLHKQIVAHPSARGVFDGTVRVGKQAQKTDASQLTRSLLLRRGATVNAKPTLQIIADDVKCSHGCTVADVDAEQVFYLRSRGLTQQQAQEVLVFSFGCEVLEQVPWPDVAARVAQLLRERLTALQ